MEKNKPSHSNIEFQEFLNSESAQVPKNISENILGQVHRDLNPEPLKVFSKIFLIHIFTGFFTLLMCPQLGVSLTSSMGLMAVLMKLGPAVCMFGCGVVFMGLSLFVSSLLIRPEEIRVFKNHQVLQISLLTFISLGLLLFFGADASLLFGFLWVLGGVFGGWISLEIGWYTKRNLLRGNF